MKQLFSRDNPKKFVTLFFVLTFLTMAGLILLIFLPTLSNFLKLGLVIAALLFWLFLCFIFYQGYLQQLDSKNRIEDRNEIEQLFLDALIYSTEDSIYLKDKDHRILMANDCMAKSLGTTREVLIGQTDLDLFLDDFATKTFLQEDEIFQSGKPLVNIIERRTNTHGHNFWTSTVKAPIKEKNEVIAILGITRKFDDVAKVHKELEYAAKHDQLTGLLNRGAVLDELNQQLRSREPLAILFIDLDDFKQVNDQHGHDFGDKLLCSVSVRLKENLREGDVIARYGGDEFIVLALGADKMDATVVAKKIIAEFKKPLNIDDQELFCSLSIGGICRCAEEFYTETLAEKLIASADKAMYQAKSHGKKSFFICDN